MIDFWLYVFVYCTFQYLYEHPEDHSKAITTSAASITWFSSKNSQFSFKVVRLSLINLDFSLSPSVSMICYNWQRKITISKYKFLLHLEWNLCQHSKIMVGCTFGILTSKKLPFQRKDFKLQLITLEYWCFYIGYFTQKYSMKSILSLSYSSNNKELSIKYIISVKKLPIIILSHSNKCTLGFALASPTTPISTTAAPHLKFMHGPYSALKK